jgi:Ca2+-binding EF-hand superfamily protein
MSKKQCLKYHQKCVGEVQSQGEAKVDKIYDQYDRDKDGYLTENDFLNFYEISSRSKEDSVWKNL